MRFSALFPLTVLLFLSSCMIVKKPSPEELAALDTPPAAVEAKLKIYLPKTIAWYRSVEETLWPSGRPLTEGETRFARALGVQSPDRVRVVALERFPMPSDEALHREAAHYGLGSSFEGGRAHGYVILLKPDLQIYPEILRHELVHVAQVERMGQEAFLRRYLIELEMMGYARSPLELEAYAKQGISLPSPE